MILTQEEIIESLVNYGVKNEIASAIAEAITFQEASGEELEFKGAWDIYRSYSTTHVRDLIQEHGLALDILEAMEVDEYNGLDDAQLQEWIEVSIDLEAKYPYRIGFFNGYLVCDN